MLCVRRWLSCLLVVYFVLMIPLTAYAGTASSSDASRSDALRPPMDDFVDSDGFDDVPLMGGNEPTGLPQIENTVKLSDVYINLQYYDMSGVIKSEYVRCGSDGYFRIERPSDYVSIYGVGIDLHKGALPSAGKYSIAINCHTNAGGSTFYKQFYVGSSKENLNASGQLGSQEVDGLYNYSEFAYRGTVSLGVGQNFYLNVLYDSSQSFGFAFDGYIKVNFTKLSSGASVDYDSPGSGTASEDLQQGMADNSAQQVEQGDTIIELIKNTIQTISSQLTAFWNQLAGEFTNLYNKMNHQHAEQLEADRQNTDQVTGAIEEHGNFIIEGLKSLFIPSDEFFKAYFDDLYAWFSERFGFLSFPIDLLIRLVDLFLESSSQDCILTLPSFSVMDEQLLPETAFNLTEFLEEHFAFVLIAIRTVTSIALIMAFVQLCESKWEEVMRN